MVTQSHHHSPHIPPTAHKLSASESGLLLLGSGPSCGVPHLSHFLQSVRDNVYDETSFAPEPCRVCESALTDPYHPNVRNNISAVIVLPQKEKKKIEDFIPVRNNEASVDVSLDTMDPRFILIDMGKTFRSSAFKWFDMYSIGHIDAILLTHAHQDAVGGVDDIRDLQKFKLVNSNGELFIPTSNSTDVAYRVPDRPMPVFASKETHDELRATFGYIFKKGPAETFARRIAAVQCIVTGDYSHMSKYKQSYLDFIDLSSSSSNNNNEDVSQYKNEVLCECHNQNIGTFKVTELPLFHGGRYISIGYMMGERERLVYLSDVSEIPVQVMDVVDNNLPIEVLVIDALFFKTPYFSHFSLEEALALVKRWRPKRTYMVGMMCRMDYEETNRILSEWVQLLKSQKPIIESGCLVETNLSTTASSSPQINKESDQSPLKEYDLSLSPFCYPTLTDAVLGSITKKQLQFVTCKDNIDLMKSVEGLSIRISKFNDVPEHLPPVDFVESVEIGRDGLFIPINF